LAIFGSSIPASKWSLHEKVLCKKLGINAKEGTSAHLQLTEVIKALRKGYSRNIRFKDIQPRSACTYAYEGTLEEWLKNGEILYYHDPSFAEYPYKQF